MTINSVILIIGFVTLVFLIILISAVVILFFQLQKLQSTKGEVSQILPQIAIVGEKVSHIEPLTQTVNGLQTDMRGLGERIFSVE